MMRYTYLRNGNDEIFEGEEWFVKDESGSIIGFIRAYGDLEFYTLDSNGSELFFRMSGPQIHSVYNILPLVDEWFETELMDFIASRFQ